jgi:FlaA1/EpsC-like NDP-sugar epimerase
MKRMLITGATGSLGSEVVGRYYRDYRIFAQGRDAEKLLKLKMRYPNIELVLGDLRCHGVREAVRSSQIVVHAAAQKYVDLAEKHCFYTIDTNVNCTHELADLAARSGVECFVFISTDKSSAPSNVYGISKYLAERLVLELADIYHEVRYVICRFGNIFGSNGSVVRLWLDATRRDAKIHVTDPNMTRFMFSIEQALSTVDFALLQGQTGDIIIPKMRSVRLRDLISLFDPNKVNVVGKRPGEKTHETLYVRGEICTGYQTPDYYVLNRRSGERLQLEDLDSATAPVVEPDQLQQWFEDVKRRAA